MAEFEVSGAPQPEATAELLAALLEYNAGFVGPHNSQPISVLIRDPETGKARGGLLGRTRYRWMFVDTFFLPEDLRKGGTGSRILMAAEEEAKARGCIGAYLDTGSFQAPAFYEKHGYKRFGTLEGYPLPGFSKFYYAKRFDQG